jgi:hypothetical protein
MPGSYVKDAASVNLATGATLNAAGSTNGTVVEVLWPGETRIQLTTGTVAGTSPTADIEVKGADDAAFTQNVVSYGRFSGLTGGAQSNVDRWLEADVYARYVRATVVLGGTTPSYVGTTITLRADSYKQTWRKDSA